MSRSTGFIQYVKDHPGITEVFIEKLGEAGELLEKKLYASVLEVTGDLFRNYDIMGFEKIHETVTSYTLGTPEFDLRKILSDYYVIRGLSYKELNDAGKALEEFQLAARGAIPANLYILDLYRDQREYSRLITFAEYLKERFAIYYDPDFLLQVQTMLCYALVMTADEEKLNFSLTDLSGRINGDEEKKGSVIRMLNWMNEQSKDQRVQVMIDNLAKV